MSYLMFIMLFSLLTFPMLAAERLTKPAQQAAR